MRQILGIVLLGLTTAVVHAHALLLVPADNDPSKIQVVYSDDFAPDLNIKDATWKRFEGLKLSARDSSGKITAVKHTKEKGRLLVHVPVAKRCPGVVQQQLRQHCSAVKQPQRLPWHGKGCSVDFRAATGMGKPKTSAAYVISVRIDTERRAI